MTISTVESQGFKPIVAGNTIKLGLLSDCAYITHSIPNRMQLVRNPPNAWGLSETKGLTTDSKVEDINALPASTLSSSQVEIKLASAHLSFINREVIGSVAELSFG